MSSSNILKVKVINMKKNIAYKYRIYPNQAQQVLISKTFGCVRFIFNKMLGDRIAYYKETGLSLKNTPAKYKKEYEWLKEVDSLALANAQLHLDVAYKNFFRDKKVGFPKFKSKKHSSNSYTTNMVNNNIKLIGNKIYLPKLKGIRIKKHREIPENYKIKSVTVSKTPTNKYYVSILCEYEADVLENVGTNYLWLDYAMNGLYVASDNSRGDYPRFYRQLEKKLHREQRKLSKMIKGSNNYQKQKYKVAKVHEKITNSRKDYLHKTSHQIANEVDGVCIEDLNLQAMSKSMHFGKSVHDNGYGLFLNMLSYKLERQGKKLIRVDKFYPSSKTCSCCGYIKKELKLSDRIYECPQCGMVLDRDYNASINIKREGMRLASIY